MHLLCIKYSKIVAEELTVLQGMKLKQIADNNSALL
jgi:hypothetical protein